MNTTEVAVLLIAAGIPTWTIGGIVSSRRKVATEPESTGSLAGTLYFWTCLCGVGVYLRAIALSLITNKPNQVQAALGSALADIGRDVGGLISDPVLAFVVLAILIIIGVCLIPGMIGIVLYLMAGALALAFALALVIQPLIALARISLAGAAIAAMSSRSR